MHQRGRFRTTALLQRLFLIAATALLINVSGCATKPIVFEPASKIDPIEPFNRGTFQFNMDFDEKVLTPIAKGYTWLLPDPFERGIHNVFNNFAMIDTILNDLLQAEFKQALRDTWRFVFNTTFGVLGLFDHATQAGFPYLPNDFGQTLAVWGIAQGPYLQIPVLGPWTTRFIPGFIMSIFVNPLYWWDSGQLAWGILALRGIDLRVASGGALEFVRGAVGDPYVFMRDAYLQRRQYLIYMGNPPAGDDDLFDALMEEEGMAPAEAIPPSPSAPEEGAATPAKP